jgi:branched-chain amino acid transport system substrate-binding protein
MRKLVLIVLVVFLSISAFSTIKVGAILPMTGGVAAFGQMIWQVLSSQMNSSHRF